MSADTAWAAELLLRGAVGGVLLFHLTHLVLPGPRAATRVALALLTVSLIGYLFCQRMEVMMVLPYPLAVVAAALCVSTTAWLWLAARGLFDDDFKLTPSLLAIAGSMVVLGLAAHLPHLRALFDGRPVPDGAGLVFVHAVAMLAFTAAAVWEVARGWRDDLVEPRRAMRRWAALGIGAYASVALVVELAVRERNVGALLPALHVAGIGLIALALAVVVARHSIGAVLGLVLDEPPAPASDDGPAPGREPEAPASPARAALLRAMAEERLYRREGLTLAALAQALQMSEAALRALINQQLGYRNFNDFLHHYRLQEAAARLVSEELPILTIALESGYGSIGPFNRAFRQRFGMTPTEYRAAARMERHRQASETA
jgi:AraC-like DNA-binding protein